MNFPTWSNIASPSSATSVAAQDSKGWLVDAGGNGIFGNLLLTIGLWYFLFLYVFFLLNYLLLVINVALKSTLPTTDPVVYLSTSSDGAAIAITNNNVPYLFSYGGWTQKK